MSDRYNTVLKYENHLPAAELHDYAADVHHAANHSGSQNHETRQNQSKQALERSWQAYLNSGDADHRDRNAIGNSNVEDEEIATLAYQFWQAGGCAEGTADNDWHRAEEQFRSEKLGMSSC